jgi:hypothetical protein
MISPSSQLPPAFFWGGPACGAAFEGHAIDKFPKHIRVPHYGRLYAYTLHFKRRNGQTLYAYRFGGVVIEVQQTERNEIE